VLAQRPAALRGTVADSLSGQPLVGVRVALVGQPGSSATDALGQFRLVGLAPSTYQLRLGALGYKLKTSSVTVVVGETRGLSLVLAPPASAWPK
jgi:hypothetical protein